MAKAFASAALVLATAILVRADNTAPTVPLDAQIGLLNFPVTCKLESALNQTFDTIFSTTAPIFGGTSQEIYYTDVVATIIIPPYITSLAPLTDAKQACADVDVKLRLTNASPSDLTAYHGTIKNIMFPVGSDAHVRIPPGDGTLPPLGPVTLGRADEAHHIFLGDVDVTIQLQDANGNNVFTPIPYCGQQNIDFAIGSINVNDTAGLPPFALSNGFMTSFSDTSFLCESGAFRFVYDCNFGLLGPQVVDLTIGGTISTYFGPGQQLPLTNLTSFLRVPPSLVNIAKSVFPNVATFDTNLPKSSADVTGSNTDVIIAVPRSGFLTVGPVTAGDAGNIVTIAIGNNTAQTVPRDASGQALLTLPIACNPPAPLELIRCPDHVSTARQLQTGYFKLDST